MYLSAVYDFVEDGIRSRRARPYPHHIVISVSIDGNGIQRTLLPLGRQRRMVRGQQIPFQRPPMKLVSPGAVWVLGSGRKTNRRALGRDADYFFFRLSDWRSRINTKKPTPKVQIHKIGSHLLMARSP